MTRIGRNGGWGKSTILMTSNMLDVNLYLGCFTFNLSCTSLHLVHRLSTTSIHLICTQVSLAVLIGTLLTGTGFTYQHLPLDYRMLSWNFREAEMWSSSTILQILENDSGYLWIKLSITFFHRLTYGLWPYRWIPHLPLSYVNKIFKNRIFLLALNQSLKRKDLFELDTKEFEIKIKKSNVWMNKITWNISNNDSCAYFILYTSRYVKERK